MKTRLLNRQQQQQQRRLLQNRPTSALRTT
jgi:hypothetical protein